MPELALAAGASQVRINLHGSEPVRATLSSGAGSWSAFVALLMPAFGRLFDLHAYGTAFALATAVPVLGLFAWGAIDRQMREPI